jgi:hypothetical protein
MSDQARKNIERERHSLLPTPPIGMNVQWYKGGDVREIRAATVVGIEGPGRVVLNVQYIAQFPETKKGVHHVSSPIHEIMNNPTTVRCGSWDYLPGNSIPKAHYKVHEEDLDRREAVLDANEALAKAQAERRAKQQAEIEAALDQGRKLVPGKKAEILS